MNDLFRQLLVTRSLWRNRLFRFEGLDLFRRYHGRVNDCIRNLAVNLPVEVLLLDQRCWLIDDFSIFGVIDNLNDSTLALDACNRLWWIAWSDYRLNTLRVAVTTRMKALEDLIRHTISPKSRFLVRLCTLMHISATSSICNEVRLLDCVTV